MEECCKLAPLHSEIKKFSLKSKYIKEIKKKGAVKRQPSTLPKWLRFCDKMCIKATHVSKNLN